MEVSEKESSVEYEEELNDYLNFPCVVQVVTDIGRAYNLTRSQSFDVIAVQQKIGQPYSIKDLENCVFAADGIHVPFICILDHHEEKCLDCNPDMKCKFVRNTEDNEPSFEDFGDAIISSLFDGTTAEAEFLPPMAHATHSITPVAAATSLVRAPKRARQHSNEAQTASTLTRQHPHNASVGTERSPFMGYGYLPPGYPVPGFSLPPREHSQHVSDPTAPAPAMSSWEEMQHRTNMMRHHQLHMLQQHNNQGHPYNFPPHVAYRAPPAAWSQTIPLASQVSQHQHQYRPHQQGRQAGPPAPVQARLTPPAAHPAQPNVHTSAAMPTCPTSPAKRRRATQPSTPPTITYGPSRQTPATVLPQKVSVASGQVRRTRTPEHHPPATSTSDILHMVPTRSLLEDSEDISEHEYVQSTPRSNAQSPGQVIDPELLNSFLHEDH